MSVNARYDPGRFPAFAVTVDLAVFTVRSGQLQVLLVRRAIEPLADGWALPGGFVHPDEDATAAAWRELEEETGVARSHLTAHLEQLATYSAPDRDPRMRVVSVAHVALAPHLPEPHAGSDAADARWWPVGEVPSLAFDHAQILADAVERVAAKLEYSSLAAMFCAEPFTIGELRHVYEAVWGVRIDPRNFHRKVTSTPGFVVPAKTTAVRSTHGTGRPAALYRKGPAEKLYPPMLRQGRDAVRHTPS